MTFTKGDRVELRPGAPSNVDNDRVRTCIGVVSRFSPVGSGRLNCRWYDKTTGTMVKRDWWVNGDDLQPYTARPVVGGKVKVLEDVGNKTYDAMAVRECIGTVRNDYGTSVECDFVNALGTRVQSNWTVFLTDVIVLSDAKTTDDGRITDLASVPIGTELVYVGEDCELKERGPVAWRGALSASSVVIGWGSSSPLREDGHCSGDRYTWIRVADVVRDFRLAKPPEKDKVAQIRDYIISIAPGHGWCRDGVNRHFKALGLEPWTEKATITLTVEVEGVGSVTPGDLDITARRGTVARVDRA